MELIIGAAVGSCVHVSGLHHFLDLAAEAGYETISLGPAVPVKKIIDAAREKNPSMIAVSYRLTPETAASLFLELKDEFNKADFKNIRLVFGGTPPVARVAKESGIFEAVFDGTESPESIRSYLRGGIYENSQVRFHNNLVDRIKERFPYPLIRHHFGRPTVEETLKGAAKIAESGVLDILSIGPDQNAQEHFFSPGEMDHSQDGAGGVALRSPYDMKAIFNVTRTGNYPLIRCYSGTRDLIRWAEMSVETINNAWAAVPLCWYSIMDGRSERTLEEAMQEHQEVMRWYAARNIPVEVNESHQWSLREAHDSLAVAMAYIAAYNAKKMGVRHYISQYMFNNPPGTTPEMDIAKMLAKNEMIEELSDDHFIIFRQVRAGLAHFSSSPSFAQGQLASSAVISMALKPHILHVVGYSEGDHAIYPDELIHSCNIVHGVLHDVLDGFPDMSGIYNINRRKNELKNEARVLIEAMKELSPADCEDPLTDPYTVARAIKTGLLDAPHFKGNKYLCGQIKTKTINGACYAVDISTNHPVSETERTGKIIKSIVNR